MRNLVWTATAVLVMLGGAKAGFAQVLTVTAKTEPDPPPPPAVAPPAGKKNVYAEGTYDLPVRQGKVVKIESKWYAQQGQNLIFAGSNTANLPAPTPNTGPYKTQVTAVDIKDGNNAVIKYTVHVILYVEAKKVTDPPVPVAVMIQENYTP